MTENEIIEMAIEAEFVSHGKPSDEESELFVCVDKDIYKFAKLVAAKAIAELESQEPVAWMDATGFIYKIKPEPIWPEVHPLKPLYTHPPQRKPLTDGQIYSMVADITDVRSPYLQFARAIEAAHGIKE